MSSKQASAHKKVPAIKTEAEKELGTEPSSDLVEQVAEKITLDRGFVGDWAKQKRDIARSIIPLIEKEVGKQLHEIYDCQPNSYPLIREAIEKLERGESLKGGN